MQYLKMIDFWYFFENYSVQKYCRAVLNADSDSASNSASGESFPTIRIFFVRDSDSGFQGSHVPIPSLLIGDSWLRIFWLVNFWPINFFSSAVVIRRAVLASHRSFESMQSKITEKHTFFKLQKKLQELFRGVWFLIFFSFSDSFWKNMAGTKFVVEILLFSIK